MYSPTWYESRNIIATYGNGDPILASSLFSQNMINKPTPGQITNSTARCVRFRIPFTQNFSLLHLFSSRVVLNRYKFAIYSSIKLWESGVVNTPNDTWATLNCPILLQEDIDYWFCITVSQNNGNAAFYTLPSPIHSNFFGFLEGFSEIPIFKQFNVSGGNFPSNLPILQNADYNNNGSVPIAFLTI